MSTLHRFRLGSAVVLICAAPCVLAQPLGVNPSAAPSAVRNPSSTNPAAAASDIRNPSTTNPSAAASQLPQTGGGSSPRGNVTPALPRQRIAAPPRRTRDIQRSRSARRATAGVEMTRPFEALEGARRDRIEFEKRMAQERLRQRQIENEQRAKQIAEKRREAAEKRAPGTRPASPAPSESTSSPAEQTAPKP
jgi:hypothetical protein